MSDQVRADFQEIIHVMRSWGRAFVKWGLALDQNRGPHAGGCGTCTPLVTVSNPSGTVSYPIDFYTLGHFSKFVLPGARRIYSSNGNGVLSAAFVNADGSKALVAFNDTGTSKTFQVRWGTRSFSYTLARYAGATFTSTGSQTPGRTAVVASTQMQASSFSASNGIQTETSPTPPAASTSGLPTTAIIWCSSSEFSCRAGRRRHARRQRRIGWPYRRPHRRSRWTADRVGDVARHRRLAILANRQQFSVGGQRCARRLPGVFDGTTSIGNLNGFVFDR